MLAGLPFRGDSITPGSPLAPVPAAELPFYWTGFATLPYAYATDDPSQLPALLTGTDGAGRQAGLAQGQLAEDVLLTRGDAITDIRMRSCVRNC